jgi:hypothetical protein
MPRGNFLIEVMGGDRDDARVNGYRSIVTNPLKCALLNKTKSSRWIEFESSAISSKKTVPPPAASSQPRLSLIAPVKAPRT